MGAGCDWLALGWRYAGAHGGHTAAATSFIISYDEADGAAAWPAATPPTNAQPLTTSAQQVRLTGLRAGIGYEVRVAAVRGGERSGWAMAPVLRTDRATLPPEPPLAPTIIGGMSVTGSGNGGTCHTIVLELPPPGTGCRSATDATLQLHAAPLGGAHMGAPTPSWRDYDAPFRGKEMEISEIHVNMSYRFRLVAHNSAGRSHPGTATDAVQVCEAPPVAALASSSLAHAARSWSSTLPGGGAGVPHGVYIVLVCAVGGVLTCCFGRRLFGGGTPSARRGGARYEYERAATGALDEELCDADAEGMGEGAYDPWAATLCVHVYVPQSIRPIQIEMSTKGVSSSSTLLKQLRLVVSEVAGRQPPLAPEELSVIHEDRDGVQQLLHSGCPLHDVYRASKVVASILGARVAPVATGAAAPAGKDTENSRTRL